MNRNATQRHIRAHFDRIAARCHGQLDARRFDAMSALLTGAAWWMNREALEILADLGAVIYAFDDLVDESDLTAGEAALRARQFAAIAAGDGCPELAFDPVARLMSSIAERLARAPLAGALWPTWTRTAREMFHGMAAQRALADRLHAGDPPSLLETLQVGRESVGVECVAVAAWMLVGAPAKALPDLLAAARHHALAARLANDLRSADRERREATINPLFLEGVDEALLRGLLRREVQAARALLGRLPATAAAPAAFLDGFAGGLVALFDEREMHDDVARSA